MKAKQIAAEQRQVANTSEAAVKLSTLILEKISPARHTMATFISRPDFHLLPEAIKNDVRDVYEKVTRAETDCRATKSSKGSTALPSECKTVKDLKCLKMFEQLILYNCKHKTKHAIQYFYLETH